MTDLDALTVAAIAESSRSAALLAGAGDVDGARTALTRAEERFELFAAARPAHARNVRLAREALDAARRAVGAAGQVTPRRAAAATRAADRAATRARA